jgi:hypothetical protein
MFEEYYFRKQAPLRDARGGGVGGGVHNICNQKIKG